MDYRYLGKSGLKVSKLCLGTMTFGTRGVFSQVGNVSLKQAKELVRMALDAGINFFDTADVYSEGESERVLAKALGPDRENSIICTKARFNVDRIGPNAQGASKYHLINACNDSLKRLNTDYIDVYMIHTIDIYTPLEETLGALTDLVKQGKIRYIGCSNYSAWMLMKALSISEKKNLERFITYQGYYSLLCRDLENEVIHLCKDQGLGIMVWSPLSAGYLSGKFTKNKPYAKGTRIGDNKQSRFIPPVDEKKLFKIIDKMEEISKNHHASIPQVAINYILKKPAMASVVIGVRKKEQLEDNIRSLNFELSSSEMDELDEISSNPLPYPYWHHALTDVYK